MNGEIHVLVGMIASGKSTYCKKAVKNGQLAVNDDAIVNMLHADEYTLYDEKLKILYKTLENNIVSLGLCLNRVVLVDRGLNVSKSSRQRWVSMARSFDVPCTAIVFPKDTPEVHASRRFKSDSRGHDHNYWLRVAEAHNKVYSEPTLDEGFNEIRWLGWDNGNHVITMMKGQ